MTARKRSLQKTKQKKSRRKSWSFLWNKNCWKWGVAHLFECKLRKVRFFLTTGGLGGDIKPHENQIKTFLAVTSILHQCWYFWNNKHNNETERFIILNEEEKNYWLYEVFNYNLLSFTSVVTDSLELLWKRTSCVQKENEHFTAEKSDANVDSEYLTDAGPDPVTLQLPVCNSRGACWFYKISKQTQLRSTLADCFQAGLLGPWTPASACWARRSDWSAESATVTGRRLIYVRFIQELPPDQSWGPEWSGVFAPRLRDCDEISINRSSPDRPGVTDRKNAPIRLQRSPASSSSSCYEVAFNGYFSSKHCVTHWVDDGIIIAK